MSTADRIAARAAEIKPLRVLLSILAAPFYLVGFLIGVLFVGAVWCYAACGVGFSDARRRGDNG